MLVLNHFSGTRIVATPAALAEAVWPVDALALRTASDELLVFPQQHDVSLSDPHAIIIDDGSYLGGWVDESEGLRFLASHCEWELPRKRPAFAQGAAAGLPIKLWLTDGRILFIVEAAFAADFLECWHE